MRRYFTRPSGRSLTSLLGQRSSDQGFTLLELIIVITVIGILATIAIPNLRQTPIRANEAVLKTNLHTLRQVLDMHAGDKGYYPASLDALVEEQYLRAIPLDPMTNDREWGLDFEDAGDDFDDFEPAETDLEEGAGEPGIVDVYSLSEETSLDGALYSEW